MSGFLKFLNEFELEGDSHSNKAQQIHDMLNDLYGLGNIKLETPSGVYYTGGYDDESDTGLELVYIVDEQSNVVIKYTIRNYENIDRYKIYNEKAVNDIIDYLSKELHLNEHTVSRGTYSKESEWDNGIRYSKKLEKIYDSPTQKIYRNGKYEFFLVDEDNDYLGQLTFNDEWTPRDGLQIFTTDANEGVKGFYKIMFSQILKHTEINIIYSDGSLSDSAINSYDRLSQDSEFKLQIRDTYNGGVVDFDKDRIKQYPGQLVMVSLRGYDDKF